MLISLPMLAFPFLAPLWVVIGLQILIGLAAGPLNPIIYAVKCERVRGNAGTSLWSDQRGCESAMPAGVLLGGFLIDGIGLRGSFAIIGALYLAATLTLRINPAIRTMDSPPLPRQSQAAGIAFARAAGRP